MTIKHVLLKSLKWSIERKELIYFLYITDIKKILIFKKRIKTIIKMIQHIKILNQFKKIINQDIEQHL